MKQQVRMLRASLYLVMSAATGEPSALEHLDRLARRHKGIPAHLYDLWLDTLVATVDDFDGQFNARVEDAWRAVLRPGIEYMTRER